MFKKIKIIYTSIFFSYIFKRKWLKIIQKFKLFYFWPEIFINKGKFWSVFKTLRNCNFMIFFITPPNTNFVSFNSKCDFLTITINFFYYLVCLFLELCPSFFFWLFFVKIDKSYFNLWKFIKIKKYTKWHGFPKTYFFICCK